MQSSKSQMSLHIYSLTSLHSSDIQSKDIAEGSSQNYVSSPTR